MSIYNGCDSSKRNELLRLELFGSGESTSTNKKNRKEAYGRIASITEKTAVMIGE